MREVQLEFITTHYWILPFLIWVYLLFELHVLGVIVVFFTLNSAQCCVLNCGLKVLQLDNLKQVKWQISMIISHNFSQGYQYCSLKTVPTACLLKADLTLLEWGSFNISYDGLCTKLYYCIKNGSIFCYFTNLK